jgi:putative transposase
MYRILREANQTGERRRQATHPARKKPELMAEGPNEIWTWDVTRLRTREKGVWLHLYVILDIFSRKALAWRLAHSENGPTATDLIKDAIARNGGRRPHTIHADRGSAMTGQDVSDLMVKLAVTRSHSRPKTSNDNPYSEAQFRTLKYDPWFPEKFDSRAHAHDFAESFFDYYNHIHRHSGIGLHTPASVHHGTAEIVQAQREATLAAAYRANPARFARKPLPPPLPTTAWINKPADPETPHPAAQAAELH